MSVPSAAPPLAHAPAEQSDDVAALVLTRDQGLVDVLQRLAAAASVGLDVRSALPGRSDWLGAGLVLLGADLAADAAAVLPRRPRVVLVGRADAAGGAGSAPDGQIWQQAVAVGAERVSVLPGGQEWVVQALAEALESGRRCAMVGVVGGCGGAGASVLSAAIAVTAAAAGQRTLLADLDPTGGGLDLVVGAEARAGLRWPELARARGRIGGGLLREALPRVEDLSVLSWGRGDHRPVPPEAATAVAGGAVRGFDLVVADLARSVGSVPAGWLRRVDLGLVVVPSSVRAVTAAAAVVASLDDTVVDLRVVVRGPGAPGLPAELVAETIGLPLLAELRPEPGLAGALERGEPPGLRRRGPLARCAGRVLDAVARVDRAA